MPVVSRALVVPMRPALPDLQPPPSRAVTPGLAFAHAGVALGDAFRRAGVKTGAAFTRIF